MLFLGFFIVLKGKWEDFMVDKKKKKKGISLLCISLLSCAGGVLQRITLGGPAKWQGIPHERLSSQQNWFACNVKWVWNIRADNGRKWLHINNKLTED